MATKPQSVAGAGAAKPGAASASSQSTTQEYVVRVSNNTSKKHSMIKFSTGTEVDFLKLTNTTVRMERENNLREYKTAHNLDMMPKFGAGSEYGREQKEEARRKKFGINIKKYNPDAQPWLMKVGKGKDAKRFKGVREGTITQNTSYYIFTQSPDGAFDAFPIEEWYNFQPVVQYKYLNSEEAEEEFLKRDKRMNMFSIMKRIKKDDDTADPDADEKKVKKKKDRSLILTDMEEWGFDEDDDDDDDDDDDEEGEKKPKKKEKKDTKKKGRKVAKLNDNDEAVEDSDEGDFDDRELDYISDSGSESELDEKEKDAKYDTQGVDQERGLKKLIDSEEESSEEEGENKEEEENEEGEADEGGGEGGGGGKEKKVKKEKKEKSKDGGDDSDSSSSSSDSEDSDIDKNEDKFSSVLFMQKRKGGSRSNTPTFDKSADSKVDVKTEVKSDGVKRKMEGEDTTDSQKKPRTESPVVPSASSASLSSGEITEEAIRRYLSRKPMTAKELVQKFKSKKPQMSKDQMTQRIGQLLKKINPERKYVNNVLYLSLKKSD
ncbi:general transcription factor IIF subunit 1-like [Mercenaria mercenaria]|uniref:general transcription factor IIF subunit 1-like n=1 Tax=Mercenaria mercenaria TaxID=6596 RepID=UPI00234F9DCB|nr:general transcription factor IIF subunit 1-like [Mercenaria mercenaria]